MYPAGRRAARRCWRTRVLPPRPWPRGSGAAQRLEFFGEHAALVAPRLLLVALARDDLSRGARDEVLVGELGRERGELLIEPGHLAGEAAALLLHVDGAAERHEHGAAVAEHRVAARASCARFAVERQRFELGEPQNRFPLAFERAPRRGTAGGGGRGDARLGGHAI